MDSQQDAHGRADLSPRTEVVALFVLAMLLAVYVLLRYWGMWGETDTATFSRVTRAVLDSGRLDPGQGTAVYSNGYGFQALLTFLVHECGLTLRDLQIFGSTLLMVWVVFPAWLLYRELTGTRRGAALAAVFLLVQPEFLFPILRGTHEKFTRGLIFLSLYLLCRSMHRQLGKRRFVALMLAFTFVAYAITSFNDLVAMSFVAAIIVALLLSLIGLRRRRMPAFPVRPVITQLGIGAVICAAMVAIFTLVVYKPATHDLNVLQTVMDQVRALASGSAESAPANPYSVVSLGWVNLPTYFVVSLATWLLIATAAVIWLWQGTRWLRRRGPGEQAELVLWALCGAFALETAAAVVVDMSGALAGNLQYRVLPSFIMVAAPLVARWFVSWKPRAVGVRRVATATLWCGVAFFAVTSTMKAANEPLLSNKWLFYQPGEMAALDWTEGALAGRQLWTGLDERLVTAVDIRSSASPQSVRFTAFSAQPQMRDFLVSDVIRAQSERVSKPLPIGPDDLITFDDGQAQVLHRRPQSPWQK